MLNYIAVYGSLRIGGTHNALMEGMNFIGSCKIPGTLYYVDNTWFPAALEESDSINNVGITGDIYFNKKPELLGRLDRYEGYKEDDLKSSLYIRKEKRVPWAHGSCLVYVYYFNNEHNPVALHPITGGDWLQFLEQKEKA